jgi:hypothetical protein
MIKFNNKESILFKKKYPRLYNYITTFILRHKKELPKIIKIKLYDYESGKNNSKLSSRRSLSRAENYDWELEINLKEIIRIYKNPGNLENGRRIPGTIKGIRKYFLFVIYHEIGHFLLKHQENYTGCRDLSREIDCDTFARDKILQGQKEFEFNPLESPIIPLSRVLSQELSPAIVEDSSRVILAYSGDNKKIKILHYSNQDFKGYIKPGYFGLNHYSRESVKESGLNRAFFYIGKGKEDFLSGAKFCYIAEIEPGKIYDFEKDPKNYKNSGLNFDNILKAVKNLGYLGISGNNGFRVVCLFRAIKYTNKKILGVKGCRLSYEIGKSLKGGKNV